MVFRDLLKFCKSNIRLRLNIQVDWKIDSDRMSQWLLTLFNNIIYSAKNSIVKDISNINEVKIVVITFYVNIYQGLDIVNR